MPIVRRRRAFGIALVLVALLSLLNPGILPLGPEWTGGSLQPGSAAAFEIAAPPAVQIAGAANTPSIIAILIGFVGNFDPLPVVGADGRGALVSGHVNCSFLGETGFLQVVLTQPSTGASAVGNGQVVCTVGKGGRQSFAVLATPVGPVPLQSGAAQACAVLVGTKVDQWCAQNGVTLTLTGAVFGPPPLLIPPPPPPPLILPPLAAPIALPVPPPWGPATAPAPPAPTPVVGDNQ
jgi:hypothetical protein